MDAPDVRMPRLGTCIASIAHTLTLRARSIRLRYLTFLF